MRINDCAIYATNLQGAQLAYRIANGLGGRVFLQASDRLNIFAQYADTYTLFYSLGDILAKNFTQFNFHILICDAETALESMVKCEQPDKIGPAVLLLDQFGQTVSCLKNCRLSGGNTLARRLAQLLMATPLFSDPATPELPAIDILAEASGLHIANIHAVRAINEALLRQEKPLVFDLENHLELRERYPDYFTFTEDCDLVLSRCEEGDPVIFVTAWRMNPRNTTLVLHPKNLHVGLGCRRPVSCDSLHAFLLKALYAVGLCSESLVGMAGIRLDEKNKAIMDLCRRLNFVPSFYTAQELDQVPVPNPSDNLKRRLNTHSVCEASALLSAGAGSYMVLEKFEGCGMTLAIAAAARRKTLPVPDTP